MRPTSSTPVTHPWPEAPPIDLYVCAHNLEVSRVAAGSGDQTVVARGVTGYYEGLAVDSYGNVFSGGIGGTPPGTAGVYKFPAGGGAPTQIFAMDLDLESVAADKSGNVYAVNVENDSVEAVKIARGGAAPTVIWSGPGPASAIAVDDAENAYILRYGPFTGVPFSVVKIPAGGQPPTVIDLSTTFSPPEGGTVFTVDPQGQNLYLGRPNGLVDVLPGAVMKVPLNGDPHTNFGMGVGYAVTGLAADTAGNVYIADFVNNRVEMVTGSGSGRQVTVCEIDGPLAVAVPPTPQELTVPGRSGLPELIAKLFGAVAADGGGWIVIGNHFIPIPPRSPVMAVLVHAAMRYLGRAIESRELGEQLQKMQQG